MSGRILITSSSFLQTPGKHLNTLAESGFEYQEARGPLRESELLRVVDEHGPFDAVLCGEDDYTAAVLQKLAPRTRAISKYGVGLDRIDLEAAEQLGIKVFNTPGTNQNSVAELTFGLMLSLARRIPSHDLSMHQGEWRRSTGMELHGKTLGVAGLGRVGREVASRAVAFGMNILGFNSSWSRTHQEFEEQMLSLARHPLTGGGAVTFQRARSIEQLLAESDVISLHMNITRENSRIINERSLQLCKRSAYIVNVSRAGLVDQEAIADALTHGALAGYAADVVEPEPVELGNPLLALHQVVLTPHVGSRTAESVERQGLLALKNLFEGLSGVHPRRSQYD